MTLTICARWIVSLSEDISTTNFLHEKNEIEIEKEQPNQFKMTQCHLCGMLLSNTPFVYKISTETMNTATPIVYITCTDCMKEMHVYANIFSRQHNRFPRMYIDFYDPPV